MLYKMGFCMAVLSAYCCLGDFRPYLGTTLLSIDVEGEACDKTWDLLFTWRGERSFSSTNNEEGLPSPCLTFRSQMKETTVQRGQSVDEKERNFSCSNADVGAAVGPNGSGGNSSTLPLITKLDKSQTNKRQANIRFWLCFPAVVRLIYRLLRQILDVFYINLLYLDYTFRNKIQNSNVNERRTRNCIFSPKLFLCVHLLENIRNQ